MSIRPLKGISVSILVIILLLGTFNFLTSTDAGGGAVSDSHETRAPITARSASSDMWPIHMGDNAHTGYSPIEVPLNNGTLWTTSIPDLKETDAPILYDGIIYIGSGDGRVRGIDPDTGNVVWSVYTGGNNHISVAVTASDGVIYFGADNGRVYAFDIETKAKLWDTNLRMDSILTSPVVADGKLFVGTSNITRSGFFAINITNGDIIWTYHMNDTANFLGIQSHPAYWNGMVYFGDGWGNVFCLDADGFSDGNDGIDTESETGPNDADIIWTYMTSNLIVGAPMLADGKLYIGNYEGYLYCFDAVTGEKLWDLEVGEGSPPNISTTPAYHDGTVYVSANRVYRVAGIPKVGGSLVAVDVSSHEILWRFNITGEIFQSSPVIADNAVVFGGEDNHVYCVSRTNAPLSDADRLIWKKNIGDKVRSTAALGMGRVFVSKKIGTGGGTLVAFGMPDLVMEDLTLSDPNPFIGELVKIRADFWNNATVPARFGVEFIVTTGNFTPKKLASEITDVSIEPGERLTVEGEWVVEAGFTLVYASAVDIIPKDKEPQNHWLAIDFISNEVLKGYWTSSGSGPERDGYAGSDLDSNRTYWIADLGRAFEGNSEPKWYDELGGDGAPVSVGGMIYLVDPRGDFISLNSTPDEGGLPGEFFRYSNASVNFIGRPAALVDKDQIWSVANKIFVLGDDNAVWAFDWVGFRDGRNDGPFIQETVKTPDSGDVLWRAPLTATPIQPIFVSGGNVIVATSDSRISAYDDDDGSIQWSVPLLTRKDPMAALDTRIFIGSGSNLRVIDANYGTEISEMNLSLYLGGSDLRSIAVLDEGLLLAYGNTIALFDRTPDDNSDGKIDDKDIDDGFKDNSTEADLIWKMNLPELVGSPPTVSKTADVIAAQSGNRVYFTSLNNGTEISNMSITGGTSGRIISGGSTFYIPAGSNPWELLAVRSEGRDDFSEIWSIILDSEPMGEGALTGKHLYITLKDGRVYSIGAANSAPIPVISSPFDDSMIFPGEEIVLDASASSDPEGDPLTYSWSFQGDPTPIYYGSDSIVRLNVTGVGRKILVLRVYDDMRAWSEAMINITLLKRVVETHQDFSFDVFISMSYGISETGGRGYVTIGSPEDPPVQPGIVQSLDLSFSPIPRFAQYRFEWANVSVGYEGKEFPVRMNTARLGVFIYDERLDRWSKAPNSGMDPDDKRIWGNFTGLEDGMYALGILDNHQPSIRHLQNQDYLERNQTDSAYRISVEYRDPDQDHPDRLIVVIDNSSEYNLVSSGFLTNLTRYSFYHAYGIELSPGIHSYYFEADDGSFIIRSPYYTLDVENTLPVVVLISPPSPVYVGSVLLFDASGSYDEDGDTITWSWDFDESNGIKKEKAGPKVDHVYDEPGVYTITLTVSDSSDSVTKKITITVIEDKDENGSELGTFLVIIILVAFLLILLIAIVIVYTLSKKGREEQEVLTRDLQERPWICPECGRDIYPGISECPDCGYEYDPIDFESEPGGITIGRTDSTDILDDLQDIEE
ncbi:MAG: PQQ-binding-like beta-propeller repeat protein [Thermoplasmatota archaeon]